MRNFRTKFFYWLAGGFLLVILIWFFGRGDNNQQEEDSGLYPVASFTDVHGLTVNVVDSSKLYIATHHGLYLLRNSSDLFRIGKAQDDYMGFSSHPTDPNIFYSSGHPSVGGNLGFQKSSDGGRTWQRVSNGAGGPVDFHAMAVSQADPNIIYGYYAGQLQRSGDEGKNWEIIGKEAGKVISLTTDPKEKNVVYASTLAGLLVSRDQGETWQALSDEFGGSPVTALVVNPKDNQEMFSYSQKLGMAKSADGGMSWKKIDADFAKDVVYYIAIDHQNPKILYAVTERLELYKTEDSGINWNKIR